MKLFVMLCFRLPLSNDLALSLSYKGIKKARFLSSSLGALERIQTSDQAVISSIFTPLTQFLYKLIGAIR